MAISTPVTAGVNATAGQHNDVRTDAITRQTIYVFEVKGTLVTGDGQGATHIIKKTGTVTKIKHIINNGTGTATIEIAKSGATVDSGVSVTTTAADDSSISSPAVTENQLLTLNIDAVGSSAANLVVQVFVDETL